MVITDQIGHNVELKNFPKRIVSLVPSQTELLYDLGLENKVVGITKFCIYPKEWFETKNRVGGTKNINFKKIAALQPDLIIANKEENTKEQIEELQKLYPVYTSDIYNLEDNIQMIETIGSITNTVNRSQTIIKGINQSFKRLTPLDNPNNTVLYLIWKNPYMSIGNNTFISDMLVRCGLINVIKVDRYPELSLEQIRMLNPAYIFLSSEPYPFTKKHIVELQKNNPHSNVILVNGEYFSWYGSRLLKATDYFIDLINKIS